MAGGEANPEIRRDIVRGPGNDAPPKVSAHAGEEAEEAYKANGAAINAKEAEKKAEEAAKEKKEEELHNARREAIDAGIKKK